MTLSGQLPDRRNFLKYGLGLAGMAALPDVFGHPARAAATDLGTVTARLSWVSNVEFGGEFLADDRGYYAAEGFSKVVLSPGGPSSPPAEIDLMQRKCTYGLSLPDLTAAALDQGAKVKTIGAQFQRNPFCIASLKSNPIRTPEEMIGKKIGVQAVNEATWSLFLKLNKLDPSKITKIPAQFDPTPLAVGDVDGWLAFSTNEPVSLAMKGIETELMMLADHNYQLVAETIVVRSDAIENNRETLKAILRAEIRGWRDAIADPQAAAKLAVEVYGKSLGLDLKDQVMQAKAQNLLLQTDDTAERGLLAIAPTLIDRNIEILNMNGHHLSAVDMFDMSLIEEVYAEDPSLKSVAAS